MASTYVAVQGEAANGIALMNTSGGGTTGGGYWINWDASGFTGSQWFWDELPALQSSWASAVANGNGFVDGCSGQDGHGHDATEEAFLYHVSHAANLNSILGTWTDQDKLDFVRDFGSRVPEPCITIA